MSEIAWFSCGATSAITCYLALKENPNCEIIYIETGSHHPDNLRFLKDCENKLFKKKILILQSRYEDVFDVIERTGVIKMTKFAPCTNYMKVRIRQEYEYNHPEIETYYWGFEIGAREEKRANKICNTYPEFKHKFPLIENNLDKASCLALLQKFDIDLPKMYKLGYNNNNCIGCVKGGMGYWNKIRVDFPNVFNKMSKLERKIGHSCLKELIGDETKPLFLDELDPDRGDINEVFPQCNIFCGMVDLD